MRVYMYLCVMSMFMCMHVSLYLSVCICVTTVCYLLSKYMTKVYVSLLSATCLSTSMPKPTTISTSVSAVYVHARVYIHICAHVLCACCVYACAYALVCVRVLYMYV